MSNAQTRQNIADALSTVAGIKGYTSTPSAPSVGDGWPQWRGADRAGGYAYTNTWIVLIVLPNQDEVTADAYADEHLELLDDALRPVLFIDSIAPAEIPAEGGPLLALLITGHSE